MITSIGGGTAYWAGEAGPKPISKLDLAGEVLRSAVVHALAVVSEELLLSSEPNAEGILQQDLTSAMALGIDRAFVDVANDGGSGVRPASITNAVTPISSTGSTLAQTDTDLKAALAALIAAGSDLQFAAWVMRPQTAVYLSSLRGTGGALAHPQMSVKGGFLLGLPVIVSAGVPTSEGTSSIVLVDGSQVLIADQGAATLNVARDASIAMADDPSSPTTLVSLLQTDCVGLRLERQVNWKLRRAGMAQVITGVGY